MGRVHVGRDHEVGLVSAPHNPRTMGTMDPLLASIVQALPTPEQQAHEDAWRALHAAVGVAKDELLAALQAKAQIEVAWRDCAYDAHMRMPSCGCGRHKQFHVDAVAAVHAATEKVDRAIERVKSGVRPAQVKALMA